MPTDLDTTTLQTHRFLYNRWAARRTAAFTMVILYAFLLWVILGQGGRLSSWLELVVIVTAAVVALVYLVLSRHHITRLCVGPDGIWSPYGMLRQIAWHEIESARYMAKRPLFLPSREWLHLTLKPGTGPLARIPLPSALENWIGHAGVRIPLHVLRAPSGEVLASVERFMPVAETDLQTSAVAADA